MSNNVKVINCFVFFDLPLLGLINLIKQYYGTEESNMKKYFVEIQTLTGSVMRIEHIDI